jgi:ankyrin repeat protein
MEAALGGHRDLVAYLLERGADVHAKDCVGRTPFSEANFWNELEILELLTVKGADANVAA